MHLETLARERYPHKTMDSNSVTFEQPLNEHTRLYLRLEHLFIQLQAQLINNGPQASRLALETLLRIVDLADRPDLKSKLLQTLRQQSTSLAQLENLDHIDIDLKKLHAILHTLDRLVDGLHCHGNAKLGDKLRHNPFLKSIRLHLNNPAGPCNFNIPAYTLWLSQPEKKHQQSLSVWVKEFDVLREAVTLILNLIRNSSPTQRAAAKNRFYQQPLDSNLPPCQLVRITLPIDYNLYPEFSVGKHRLSIQFKSLCVEDEEIENDATTREDILFQLCCCRV